MKRPILVGWHYSLVFTKETNEFITAEIYDSVNGLSFCEAPIVENSLEKLQNTLLGLCEKSVNNDYYIWERGKLKHASKQNK